MIIITVFLFSLSNISSLFLGGIYVSASDEYSSGYWHYVKNNNKTILITSYTGMDTIIDIPNKIDGLSVTGIGDSAFRGSSVSSITIPASVTSIGDHAFSLCRSLNSINIPNNVTYIGSGAFEECTSLTSIRLPSRITSINDYTFQSCESLSSITIPDGVTSIGWCAFSFCKKLTSITIPASVKTIDDFAFVSCVSLKIKCCDDTYALQYAIKKYIPYDIQSASSHTHKYTSKITKAATCTSTGIRTYTCVDGDDSYVEVIPKTAHNYKTKVVDPTYDTQGYTLYTCSVCGDTYKDTFTAKLTKLSISKAIVTGITNSTYTGKAIKPTPTVKLSNNTLISGKDYTVSYSNNVNIGKATVTITGKGVYTGSKTINFSITKESKKDISKCTIVLGTSSYTYDGNAKKPAITIKDGTKVLKSGTDYTVSYSNNVNIGTANVLITGKGTYTGSKTVNFSIKKDISKCTIVLGTSSYTYDGNAKKPAVTVKDGSRVLISGTDYKVSYSNNVKVGLATVVVSGKGNYTGTKTLSFVINPTGTIIKVLSSLDSGNIRVGLTPLPGVTGYEITYATNKAFTSDKKVVTCTSAENTINGLVNGKTYYVKARAYKTVGGIKYYSAYSDIKSVLVTSKLKSASLSITKCVYTGEPIKPTVIVKDSSNKTVSSSFYTVKYSNNKLVGKATVTITGKGNYSGTIKKSFVIMPKYNSIELTSKKKAFKVSWKKDNMVSGYMIMYSTDNRFSSDVKTIDVSNRSTTSKTISGLNKGKTYYVKVMSYVKVDGKKYGNYSPVRSVKTD